MKIIGSISLKLVTSSFTDELRMHITYKHPNKLLKRRIKVLLSCTWAKTYEEFLELCLEWLNDKESLKKLAIESITEDYFEVIKESPSDKNIRKINTLIKEINSNKLLVEVEIEN